MAAIFPSDSRIRDIVYGRVEQLLDRKSSPTAPNDAEEQRAASSDENITNIYERIALDICAECLNDGAAMERHQWLTAVVAGPADRLRCMQQQVLRRVKKLLHNPHAVVSSIGGSNAGAAHASLAHSGEFNGQQPHGSHTSTHVKRLTMGGAAGSDGGSSGDGSGALGGLFGIGAKRKLWWNEILLHEMMEDDATWTNFDAERTEVLLAVSDEIVRMLVAEALTDCERAFERKAQLRKDA